MSTNLYNIYIKAWSNYEEDKVMKILTEYLERTLREVDSFAWGDIKYFHDNYTIHEGYYYGVKSDYAIGNNEGKVVWEGDYPTEEVIKKILEEE